MARHSVSASAAVKAPAQQVYAILADYREGHPHILPQPPFGAIEVEQGGHGAGTVIRFPMTFFGREQIFRALISEPQPGRVLMETYPDTGNITSFTVVPDGDGPNALVTINIEMPMPAGPLGTLRRFVTTRLLRPVLVRQLAQLAAFAEESRQTASPGSSV